MLILECYYEFVNSYLQKFTKSLTLYLLQKWDAPDRIRVVALGLAVYAPLSEM